MVSQWGGGGNGLTCEVKSENGEDDLMGLMGLMGFEKSNVMGLKGKESGYACNNSDMYIFFTVTKLINLTNHQC